MTSIPILFLKEVTKTFGDLRAVDNVDYTLNEGELAGIIGPNGAGKSTLINVITGFYLPESGKIFYQNKDITGKKPEERFEMGIARTFQLSSIFGSLTVKTNLGLSALKTIARGNALKTLLLKDVFSFEAVEKKVDDYMKLFGLGEFADRKADELPLGLKRIVEMAMTFICEPKLVFLDEPLAGLSETEINEVLKTIRICSKGRTVVIVDHKVSKVQELVKRLTVMHEGRIVADGPPEQVVELREVRKVYWGY